MGVTNATNAMFVEDELDILGNVLGTLGRHCRINSSGSCHSLFSPSSYTMHPWLKQGHIHARLPEATIVTSLFLTHCTYS